MNLSSAEKHWLPWLGRNGCLHLAWSCWVNRQRYHLIENTFEGMAESRRKLLLLWFGSRWSTLESLTQRLQGRELLELSTESCSVELSSWLHQTVDFTELFLIDSRGRVLASSCQKHVGKADLHPAAIKAGLKSRFLHGPYSDRLTLELGASSSHFHDSVTLMFYQPLLRNGQSYACLCGRIPNDVMSDVLQREDGHVFRDSGDNYLFMVESRFEPDVTPGTALSRSRFEDATFSLGENLKQGIRTGSGTVTVQQHTELELVFTDPATGQLHPGVRETMRRGHNLYVKYPGYSDYRHVPVIGKGITFTVPGSPDQWGMMCEADLEEVYRRRSLGYQAGKRALTACFVTGGAGLLLDRTGIADVSNAVLAATMGWAAAAAVFSSAVPFGKRTDLQSRFLLAMAECGASLRERLKWDSLSNDEIGNLGRWINSFVDKMDQTVGSSLNVAEQVQAASTRLHRIASEVASGSDQQRDVAKLSSDAIEALDANSGAVARQSQAAKCIAEEASTASARGAQVVQQAMQEMGFTSQVINDLAIRIDTLNRRSDEINTILVVIKAIADQTNLLALNAAIEAARAGEHGRGFSVVADEVRSLAQRTVQSTSEITTMIDSIQSDTKAAVTMMDQCRAQVDRGALLITDAGAALGQINEGADQAAQGISAIAEAAVEQAAISQSIAEQVRTITQFANHSSAKAQEALTAVRDLEQLSRDLTGTVSKFSL